MTEGGHGAAGSMRWLLTYADMITLLLAFFVIMYAVSKVDARKYKAFSSSVQVAFRATGPVPRQPIAPPILAPPDQLTGILHQIEQDLDAVDLRTGRIQVERSAAGILLRFQDTVFFERGKAELGPEARRILDRVAAALKDRPNAVEAEGHTDALPIRSHRFASNWELSVARATAVIQYLIEAHGISPLRLSARGLGEHLPLYPHKPAPGEPRNRRVELRILKHG